MNNITYIIKHLDVRFKLNLLTEKQYNKLNTTYNNLADNPTLFYDKFMDFMDTDLTENFTTYKEVSNNLSIKYALSGKNNLDRFDKFYTNKYKNLIFRLYQFPFNYYILNNGKQTISIKDDGYYEIILLENRNVTKELVYKLKFPQFNATKEFFINKVANILYIPYKLKKGNLEIELAENQCHIILKKTKYITQPYLQNLKQNKLVKFEINLMSQLDILFHITLNDEPLFKKTKNNLGTDKDIYKIYHISDNQIILIIRHLVYRNKYINVNLANYPILNEIIDNLNSKIHGSYIIYYNKTNTNTVYNVKDSDTIKKMHENNAELRYKIIKKSYINFVDRQKERILIKNGSNTLNLLMNLSVKDEEILDKKILFENIGPSYCISKDDLKNLEMKRINLNKLNFYCDIKNIIPSYQLNISYLNTNTYTEIDLLDNNKSDIDSYSDLLEYVKKLNCCLKIYLRNQDSNDIIEDHLIYVKTGISLNVTNIIIK